MKKVGTFKKLIILMLVLIPIFLAMGYITKVKEIKYIDPDNEDVLVTHYCVGFVDACSENDVGCIPDCVGVKYNYKCYRSTSENYKVKVKC